MQRETFLCSEGDAYYERNRGPAEHVGVALISALQAVQARPTRILEIGASDGRVLQSVKDALSCEAYGVEPSAEAVKTGNARGGGICLSVGTADKLEFEDGFFDLVVFGFCLYLCDPEDHFRIAAEANRVLRDGGLLVIFDFYGSVPYKNEYKYKPGVFSYKMDYAGMFTWHPGYRLLSRKYIEHAASLTLSRDEAVVLDILHKDMKGAFPRKA
jgi:ubiquinone/menaquinone biosynthesis C-methylase UbiE